MAVAAAEGIAERWMSFGLGLVALGVVARTHSFHFP